MKEFIKNKYFENKRLIVELIWTTIFLLFGLKYFGIPDKYDYYIEWFLILFLVWNIFLYLRFIKRELKEILEEK